jgi:hypothetical protein
MERCIEGRLLIDGESDVVLFHSAETNSLDQHLVGCRRKCSEGIRASVIADSMVRYICGDIRKRDASFGQHCPRGIGDGAAQASLVDGLRAGRWAGQQYCDRNEPD